MKMLRMKWVFIMVVVLLAAWLNCSQTQASICNGRDLGCLAYRILPNDQTNTKKREWAAYSGHVTGYNKNGHGVIEFKMRFDQESVETLRYVHDWNTREGIFINGFGLEVDICDPFNMLRFGSVENDFPASSRPTRDTDVCNIINSCKNSAGLLIKNAAGIEPYVDYTVKFNLKDLLPEVPILINPSLQIVADTKIFRGAKYGSMVDWLFDWNLLGGYLEKFDFFALETESYEKGWWIYPDGHEGVCWESKEISSPCAFSSAGSEVLLSEAVREIAPRYFGVTTLPYGDFQEVQELYPDFITQKVTLSTPWNQEVYAYGYNETVIIDSYIKNIGEANWAGDRDDMYVRAYLSNGYKEDSHSEWRNVGTGQIQRGNIDVGTTKHEAFTINLATIKNGGPLTPGIYNLVVCADRKYDQDNGDGEVPEMHKSNNCSTEAVFEIKDSSQVNFQPKPDLIAHSLSASTTFQGGQATVWYHVSNVGAADAPDTYTAIEAYVNGIWTAIASPNCVRADHATAGYDHAEAVVTNSIGFAPGSYQLRIRADHDNQVAELNEDNNVAQGTLIVVQPPMPNFVAHDLVGAATFQGNQTTVWYQILNNGSVNAPVDTYTAIELLVGGSWVSIASPNRVRTDHATAGYNHSEAVTTNPLNFTAGTYSLRVRADVYNAISESNESDNIVVSSLTIWPIVFRWSCTGPISGMICTQINEGAEPSKYTWYDNYFCANQDYGIRWSSAGPIAGMRCTQIYESADPYTWKDNYLCVPSSSVIQFYWSSAGPIAGKRCIQWAEPADPHTWMDNYLCTD